MSLVITNLGRRKRMFAISIIFLLSFFVLIQVVLANDYGLTETIGAMEGKGGALENIKTEGIPLTIGRIIGAGLAFIGIAFFILMIYGGFLWMFARGNEQQVAKAKELIMSAIIGLVIVLAAYAITMYVGEALTGG